MRNTFLLLFISLLLTNCDGLKKEDLKGSWTAIQLTEEGDSLAVNLEEITLRFGDFGYDFTSTLNYKEEGIYTIKDNLLMTLDSLNNGTKEKIVEITKLQNDSMFIRMNEAGKERILVMTKR